MSENSKSKRTRSPAYPAIDLEESLAKAKTLWGKINRQSAPIETIVGYWNYDSKSSAGYSATAALLKFGLLEDEGKGGNRNVKLTESAIKLIYNPNPDDVDYIAELKQAALRPKIHAELWAKYNGFLPDNAVIKRHLVVDLKFNDQYVDSFIEQFRKTIEFAKLAPSDTIEPMSKTSGSVVASAGAMVASGFGAIGASMSVLREFTVPLSAGTVSLRVPYPMEEDDFKMFIDTLNLWKKKLVKKSELDKVIDEKIHDSKDRKTVKDLTQI